MLPARLLTHLALWATTFGGVCALVADQHILPPPGHAGVDEASKPNFKGVINGLKKAEIIPTVLDDFTPSFNLTLSWSPKAITYLGNTLKPKALQKAPDVTVSSASRSVCAALTSSNLTFTVVATDPDAPSRDDPRWSEFCHWIATGITLSPSHFSVPAHRAGENSCAVTFRMADFKEIMPYKPPSPPKKTGKHRYVFVLLAPANGTSQGLNLTKPGERQQWGTGKERHGVRDWARENGLAVLGANFIYSQHKKQ